MSKNTYLKRPLKDERDKQIDTHAKSYALEFMIAASQVLTVICFVKGNSAWKGSLALLFIGIATIFFYKADKYSERTYGKIGFVVGFMGAALLVWFGISG
ncbi:hypothetical protein Ami103574_01730 [Aminipila butyrica]|uniref:Uncharacterized protein n=1 Tax=Aminipila butyrica TaxID=433296 RepID=A0A858BRE2_9FIRM|nr:hypothetical protein [Aminipila butyrica]QIB68107.1 hypothetical protein Ami103574_01730 [Aminipila butyrica]